MAEVKRSYVDKLSRDIWRLYMLNRGVISTRDINMSVLIFVLIRRIECIIAPFKEKMRNVYTSNTEIKDNELMDQLLKKSFNTRFYNVSELDLESVSDANDVYQALTLYLEAFNPEVRNVIDQLGSDLLFARLNQAQTLRKVVSFYAILDLGLDSISEPEMGALVTSLIHRYAIFDRLDVTPELYIKLIQTILFSEENFRNPISIYDPVCGYGYLLRAIASQAYQHYKDGVNVNMYGQDVSRFATAIATIIAMLIGDDYDNIVTGNTLTEDRFPDQKFQYIVADLPIGLRWNMYSDSIASDRMARNRFAHGLPSSSDSQMLFIQHILSKMDNTGCRVAFISNASLLNVGRAGSTESKVRQYIIENDLLECLVAIPPSRQTGTSVNRYIWILSNNKEPQKKGKVRLIDCNRIREFENLNADEDLIDFVHKVFVEDYPRYSRIVNNNEFGKYQITLVNSSSKKKNVVDVPMTEDVYKYLELIGYTITNIPTNIVRDNSEADIYALKGEGVAWEIDYPSTHTLYQIDFTSFFTETFSKKPFDEIRDNFDEELSKLQNILDNLDSSYLLAFRKDLKFCESTWYNKVPRNWSRTSGSLCLNVKIGSSSNQPISPEDEFPYLSISYIKGISLDERKTSRKAAFSKGTIVKKGDSLLIINGPNSGEYLEGLEGALSNTLALVEPIDANILDLRYLRYLLIAAEPYLKARLNGLSTLHLSKKVIQDMTIYLPPIEEQKSIAKFLDTRYDQMKSLRLMGFRNQKFEEYLSSLIYEAVTGKLDLDDMK